MRRLLLIVLPVLLLVGAAYHYRYQWLPKAEYDGQPNRYRVVIDDAQRRATVEASIWVDSTYLSMFDVQAVPGLPEGIVDLVDDLQVRDADGDLLSPRYLGVGDYEVRPGQRLSLSYSVRLEHDDFTWPAGKEEVAYRSTDGWLFKMSSLLFADGGATPQGAMEIRFELPEGWQAYTPWQRAEGEHSFHAANRRELINNVAFFGQAHVETIQAGGVEITLVLGSRYRDAVPQFRDLLDRQARTYAGLFGGQPLATRYLVVVNEGEIGDGGAFSNSFSQLIVGEADDAGRVVWGHTMAHELLHFWNGLSLVPADPREEWFKEGVTDYLTIATLAQNGFYAEPLLLKRLELHQQRQVLARMMQRLDMSVRESGQEKAANRLLVYGGGAITGLMIDAELRSRSSDRYGLPDLMAALYAEFARVDARYTLDDIQRLSRERLGVDLGPVLARSAESTQIIDPTPALAVFGLRMHSFAEEIYLSRDPAADPAATARFDAVFAPVVAAPAVAAVEAEAAAP